MSRKALLLIIVILIIVGVILFIFGLKNIYKNNYYYDYTSSYTVQTISEDVSAELNNGNNNKKQDETGSEVEHQNELTEQETDNINNEPFESSLTENLTTIEEVDLTPETIEDNKEGNKNATSSSNYIDILFLGIDRTSQRDETRISHSTDTIMLVRINTVKKEIKVLSIPRDTYAYIPVIDKMDKINSAYAYGFLKGKAVESTKDAINNLLKQPSLMDFFFTLDMEPIPDIIDELGGVEIDVEIDMQSHGVNLSKGLQLLDGKSSFDYIRWRYGEDGDIGRIKRQHKFIKTMFTKFRANENKDTFINLLFSYDEYIDTDMELEQIVNLFDILRDIDEDNIMFYLLPGTAEIRNDVSYWIANENEIREEVNIFVKQ